MKKEILIVDDDRLLLKTLSAVLDEAGYAVRTAANGAAALAAVRLRRPDLVLLDVMMPKVDGFDTCRQLRDGDAALPILFLTALDTTEDEIKALGVGGDGYIVKSVPDEILLARIAATLRSRGDDSRQTGDFMFEDWRVDAEALTLRGKLGRQETITDRELYLLRLFAAHPDEVFTRETLVARLWGVDGEPGDNTLSVVLYVLRKKLGQAGEKIETRRGLGYVYRP